MKILSVVTPPSIYYNCYTQKIFWEGNFTPMNIKNGGRYNVRRHRDIRDGDNYINLEIYLCFGSMDKMEITSTEPKDYLVRTGKGLITSLGINTIRIPKKNKKARYNITNVSLKDISKIIKEFEKLPYERYVRKRLKIYLMTVTFSSKTAC